MENEVPLMTKDGTLASMVKIPPNTDLPDLIFLMTGLNAVGLPINRYFVLKNGGFIEALPLEVLGT